MVSEEFIKAIITSFVKLFIILDPFLGLAVFVSLTKGMSKKEKAKQAFVASFVALALLLFFLFLGLIVIEILGITLSSFRVAGGIILLLLGIQAVLGIEFAKKSKNRKAAAVIIGTPLLCGPGAITTVILLSKDYGIVPPLIAIFAAIIITWVMLYFSDKITHVLGDRVVEVISRVLGLILAAVAAEMIKNGVVDMIKSVKG